MRSSEATDKTDKRASVSSVSSYPSAFSCGLTFLQRFISRINLGVVPRMRCKD
jgi:hypothetical protein